MHAMSFPKLPGDFHSMQQLFPRSPFPASPFPSARGLGLPRSSMGSASQSFNDSVPNTPSGRLLQAPGRINIVVAV
jgi:hypothetical protein